MMGYFGPQAACNVEKSFHQLVLSEDKRKCESKGQGLIDPTSHENHADGNPSKIDADCKKVTLGRENNTCPKSNDDLLKLPCGASVNVGYLKAPFKSRFAPNDMRQLALVAHNNMKPAMKDFIQTYSEILKKFRITGTQTTMRMCKALWGENDPSITYGLTCKSGPLGGDAQIAALMCMEDLGALIFFVDPLSAHPHQADIDSLIRLANCGNVIVCSNPTSACSMMHTLHCALMCGCRGMIPSFFQTLESPSVEPYRFQQELALEKVVNGISRHTHLLAQEDFSNTKDEGESKISIYSIPQDQSFKPSVEESKQIGLSKKEKDSDCESSRRRCAEKKKKIRHLKGITWMKRHRYEKFEEPLKCAIPSNGWIGRRGRVSSLRK